MNQNDRHDNQEIVNWLKEHFPRAFSTKKNDVKPLQLGVMECLLDFFERLSVPPFSKKRLRQGLNFYTSSNAYLSAQKEGVYRINLYGQDIEPVDAEQAKYAMEKLMLRREAKKKLTEKQSPDAEVLNPLPDSSKA
jgi:ProP effector